MRDGAELTRRLAAADWAGAERLLRRSAAARRADASVFYNLALVLERQGETAQRITWLKRAVAARPGYARAWYELGRAALDGDEAAAADAAFARALAADPADVQAARMLLRLRLARGDWPGAGAVLPALPADPETRAAAYRVACERGQPADTLRAAMLADPAGRPEALKALTRVARGRVPLRLPLLRPAAGAQAQGALR